MKILILIIFYETQNHINHDYKRYNAIYDGISYNWKGDITDSINHNVERIRNDSFNPLPIEKISTFHNVITVIKSVVNRNKFDYYYNIFLEKG